MPIEINGFNNSQSNVGRKPQQVEEKQVSSNPKPSNDVGTPPQKGESVSFSNKVQDLRQLEDNVKKLPDVDQDKVARIKAAIEDGSYQVNADKVAQKMLGIEKAFSEAN